MMTVCRISAMIAGLLVLSACAGTPGQVNTGGERPPDGRSVLALTEPVRLLLGVDHEQALQQALDATQATLVDRIPELKVAVVAVAPAALSTALQRAKAISGVRYAEADGKRFASDVVPNDPLLPQQWGLTTIQARRAWGVTTGASGVKIAVLDTGIDLDHPDLKAKLVGSRNFTRSATSDDRYGHGTHVAGIAAGSTNNRLGVAGAGFRCTLLNVKVLGDDGSGHDSWVAKGIVYAANTGAKVINMSLGSPVPSETLRAAVSYAVNEKRVVVVAAAGNDGFANPNYPAFYEPCIAVAATDQQDRKAFFSNYGTWVDVAAPGVGILSTLPNHPNRIGAMNYGRLSGTSMAAPFVAGEAALLWSRLGLAAAPTQIRSRIESGSDTVAGSGLFWRRGRINMARALAP